MNRRDCLKNAALLAAGTVLPGCSEAERGVASAPVHEAGTTDARAALHEQGATPIEGSGWTQPAGVFPAHPALDRDLDCDVLVIGAGLAGSSVALHLAEAGSAVVVLEARQPGWGASGRNAGHVLPTLKDVALFERFPDRGKAFLQRFREHNTITFDLARRHGIDCDAVQSGYLHAATRESVFASLRTRAAYWQREQAQTVEFLTGAGMRAMTGSDYYPYGVLYCSGGRVNPYRFTHGLIAAAMRAGARVFGDSEARTLVRDGERWRVHTAASSVRAARVVFCTNAYPTAIVPAFRDNFYPLTAYALTTTPLPEAARSIVMPGGATMAEEPVDLDPLVVDGHGRIVTSSLPSTTRPADAAWHFANHLRWIHRTWPATRDMDIRLADYWTGRVALREREFPGVFALQPGVYGLMHFNAWGNLMAPLMGMLLAEGLAADRPEQMPFPLETPVPVASPNKQSILLRSLLIPAARVARRLDLV